MGPRAIGRPCELWGSFGLLLSEESVSDFVGLFPYGYQAGGFQHVPLMFCAVLAPDASTASALTSVFSSQPDRTQQVLEIPRCGVVLFCF